ncbi:hypothetical protein C9J85_01050 [Haloferax sp. wsp5]|nr:hypothetical protein C9J85_01050 [Haloferax sp. wsp5]
MVEAFVRLLCPECGKDWETNPTELPAHRDNYSCQSCRCDAASPACSRVIAEENNGRTVPR